MIKLEIPSDVQKILNILSSAGYEAWCVGGCVRDALLSHTPTDYDIASSADPEAVMRLFEKVIPTGIKHGTVTVVINSVLYEVTKYRTDGKYTDHRHPDRVEFTDNFEDDLARRDFTVNAMGYNPKYGLFDPFCGMSDLKNGIIRTVGDPEKRFSEDALRILRAIRFCATLGFKIEEKTLSAIKTSAYTLENISAERVLIELKKTLASENPQILSVITDNGGLEKFGICGQTDLSALKKADNIFELRFAALVKLCGADIHRCCELLRLSTKEKNASIAYFTVLSQEEPSIENIKPLAAHVGYENLCRAVNTYGYVFEKDVTDIKKQIEKAALYCEPYCVKMLALSGEDIKNMGFSGEKIGFLQKQMLKQVLKKPNLNNREDLLKIIENNHK